MKPPPKRFEVFLIQLDPTQGAEIQKTRPCVVISPDEMNTPLKTIIIAPLTSKIRRNYPMRVHCQFEGKNGQIALDQLRAIDVSRALRRLGSLDEQTALCVIETLQDMFAL
ncbi:MAG: type II toxin-antitoxin system PemK/MazF family toxin [Vampirovibrionales bacterium]|nr:type II toxin-antitoxin system PemK/MazF family toxin [Vampirovibrionales bacterium]